MPNRLAHAKSLYLRKHADNPIAWWEWSDQALATAQQENKPIFLSVGYSSCHWCTVMEGEAFSDATIAAYMNANFLPIKVDREERPDLDSIYMQALQMMTGQGGWPLNIFLTPHDRIPFYGGTYFPLEPRYGRPGFLKVLQALRHYYDTEKQDMGAMQQKIMASLQSMAHLDQDPDQALIAMADLWAKGLDANSRVLNFKDIGPSFPMIPYAELVLRQDAALAMRPDATGSLEPDSRARLNPEDSPAARRGLDLVLGGIFDHVAGGFHRYTVDPSWTVPHFEKMLYDNGQIMEYLANLWATGWQEPAISRAIAGTVRWLKREMTAPEGYFYAAQDADSFITPADAEPEEGAFYAWRFDAVQSLLPQDAVDELAEQFTLTEAGNFDGQNVLQRKQTGALSPRIESSLAHLFASRYGAKAEEITTVAPACNNHDAKTLPWPGRIPPVTDTKMIVAWNSLMISGLARAAVVWQQPDYLVMADRAAQFILTHQSRAGRFHRLNYDGQTAVLAQAEDYALFIKALLDLHQAGMGLPSASPTSPETWLTHAARLQDEFDDFLWSLEGGGYYNAPIDASSDLIVRERSYQDNATPSANGIAVSNLVRLFLLTETVAYLDHAEATLKAFASIMQKTPQSCPSLFSGLDWYRRHSLVRTTVDHLRDLATYYLPTTVLKPDTMPPGAIALVCQGLSCQEPAQTRDQLWQQLQASRDRA